MMFVAQSAGGGEESFEMAMMVGFRSCPECNRRINLPPPHSLCVSDAKNKTSQLSKTFGFFFHIEAELFHCRPIVDGEQHRVALGSVLVVMPFPRRHGKDIALLILQALIFDHHGARAFESEVKGCAVVAVRQRFLPFAEQLRLPRNGWQSRSAVDRA